MTKRLTMSQALIRFLEQQYVVRDGEEHQFFGGCFGIFGHGNVAGVGQALQQTPTFPYTLCRNEQGMVHTAAAYAKASNRLRTLACTTSIGPGATNMITAAAGATINRLPVLLLPGEIFARRDVAPVLQQLEASHTQDISVNDCFRPISRYWDRIYRPEQIITALPEVMRVLTSPAETGAATLCLPQDVQVEAYDYPDELFARRTWSIPRARADEDMLKRAANWIAESKQPIIVAGGGVHYSDADSALAQFASETGIAVAESQAGKGALHYQHPQSVGAMGVTGTPGANIMAREADLVIAIGTRLADFTTASWTAFQNEQVRFININVAELDASKQGALPLTADARVTIEALQSMLSNYQVDDAYQERVRRFRTDWDSEVDRIYSVRHAPLLSQGEVIGAVNSITSDKDVVVCAAGSMPGDLHKLWRTRDPKGYHVEYGYSCMGYEVAGGLGVKMASPEREVYVLVGDASYLMMSQEIATAVQEGIKLNIVLLDNHGFASIGALSESVGSEGFGTRYQGRTSAGLEGDVLAVDYAANARSLGAHAVSVKSHDELAEALRLGREMSQTNFIVVETYREHRVGGHESWWDVPVAEISESETEAMRTARSNHAAGRKNHRIGFSR